MRLHTLRRLSALTQGPAPPLAVVVEDAIGDQPHHCRPELAVLVAPQWTVALFTLISVVAWLGTVVVSGRHRTLAVITIPLQCCWHPAPRRGLLFLGLNSDGDVGVRLGEAAPRRGRDRGGSGGGYGPNPAIDTRFC